jgi:RNA polymerase sigma-70 factor (ECF subfamily)
MTIQELEQCIALYGKDIYSFCCHLTREKESADDLYQDTFLEAMKKITAIRYEENPKSYLLSIALRIWKNHIRKIAWRSRIAPVNSDDSLMEQLSTESDFTEQFMEEEECKQLWSAINHLQDKLRIPLLLYYMENQSVSEIAKLLSLPQGTVKSRLYQARKLIRKELEAL